VTLLLSRARLVTHRSRAQSVAALLQKAAAADAGHALIWSLFPQDDQTRRFLYRETARGEYLILSHVPPIDEAGLWSLESRDYAPDLQVGDRLAFSLRADVQINAPPEGLGEQRQRGRREPLHAAARRLSSTPEAVARDWVAARLERHGAQLLTIPHQHDSARDPDMHGVAPREHLRIHLESRLRFAGGSKIGPLQPVLLEGAIEMIRPDVFTTLLANGLGRSRGYGCGLLLLRRLST